MRIVAFLFALCAAGAAFAQNAAPGFGPYRFGMTPEEARAAAPGEWRDFGGGGQFSSMGGPPLHVGSFQFFSSLQFSANRLHVITLHTSGVADTKQRCDDGVHAILAALSRDGGPFSGPRTITEFYSNGGASTLPDGSVVRRYAGGNGEAHTFANRPGLAFAELRSAYGPASSLLDMPNMPAGLNLCRVELSFSQTAPLTEAELRANEPTQAELEGVSHSVTSARWTRRPNAQSFARYYPPAALEAGIEGRVELDCLVGEDGGVRCRVASETPPEQGFGFAALAIARDFQMAGETDDGTPTSGWRVRIPLRFNVMQ